MGVDDTLLSELAALLAENAIGTARITPRPRGGRLAGESRGQLEMVLAQLEAACAGANCLVYGNGCFAVGRYSDAAAVYESILRQLPAEARTARGE